LFSLKAVASQRTDDEYLKCKYFLPIYLLISNINMVKLTADLIAKQAPGHNKRRADESVEHYLSRLTHLPFQNRGIESIV
jgi:hypothetical protein